MNDSDNKDGRSLWEKISQYGKSVYQNSMSFIDSSREKIAGKNRAEEDTLAAETSGNHEVDEATELSSDNIDENKEPRTGFSKFLFGFNVAYNVIKNLVIIFSLILLIGGAFAGGAGVGLFASLVSGQTPPSYEDMQVAIGNVEQTSTMEKPSVIFVQI